MRCELCDEESNVIYATRKYGLICGDCRYKMRNSEEEKLKEKEKMLRMYKKYGISI